MTAVEAAFNMAVWRRRSLPGTAAQWGCEARGGVAISVR